MRVLFQEECKKERSQSLIAFRVMKMRCQFFSFVIFLFIASSCVKSQTQNGNVNYRLSNAVIPSFYDLNIHVEVDFYSFNGTVTIDFYTNRAVNVIEMHSVGLTISGKASVKSGALESQSTYIFYWNDTEKITIGLDRTLAARSNHSITLIYSGRLKEDMKGLYLSSYYNGTIK